MTNEVVNVPELRFTGFEDEWKKKKLDDVANYRRGSFPQPYGNKEWYDEKNGEPFVQVVDVDKNMKLHDQTKQKISDLAKPKSVKGFKGDIVVTLQGSIGRVALLHYDAYIDRTLLLIYSFKIEMNKNYFKYVLYLLFLKEKERAPGGTIKTITKKVLSNFKIDIPNVGEQEKIGEFFSKLDRQIELEEQKLAKLEEQKKGYMQKLFSQELRFKDDSGCDYPNWKYNYLGNYMISHDEKTTENNQYPVLTSSREGLFLQKDYFTRDVASKDNTGYNVVPYSYFTYRHMSDDLVFKFNINYIVQKGIVSTLYPVFKTTSDLDNYFLKEILNNGNEFKKYALMQKQGGSRTYMYFSKLKQLKLHIPVLKEQEKISVFLKKLDSLIEKQSSKVELLKQRKLGFLQKMFV
ncbi:restriction endonuclease subunit S [Mammaliicoccus fleurettii]|uniref:restriction endonuclease subunit S n=1 Tax=Mammaliicoccus fleurettii TaxID=150056 RepID=UPI001C499D72|nr:restriction endonuclease subunit S [Mammaliicoccus fleurettii]